MRIEKHILHRDVERGGDAKGEIERGIVPFGLQRHDGVARNAHAGAKLLLRPAAFGAKRLEAAFQGFDPLITGVTSPNRPQTSG